MRVDNGESGSWLAAGTYFCIFVSLVASTNEMRTIINDVPQRSSDRGGSKTKGNKIRSLERESIKRWASFVIIFLPLATTESIFFNL